MPLNRLFRTLINVTLLAALGILLQACAGNKFATLQATSQALPQAEFQILGQTKTDQVWIDKTIEAEVAIGMPRPKARPANLGGASKTKPPVRSTILKTAPVVKTPSHGGGIALPAPHTSAPALEDPVLEPEKPAPPVVAPPHKPSVLQKLRNELEAAKARIRKLEGR